MRLVCLHLADSDVTDCPDYRTYLEEDGALYIFISIIMKISL